MSSINNNKTALPSLTPAASLDPAAQTQEVAPVQAAQVLQANNFQAQIENNPFSFSEQPVPNSPKESTTNWAAFPAV